MKNSRRIGKRHTGKLLIGTLAGGEHRAARANAAAPKNAAAVLAAALITSLTAAPLAYAAPAQVSVDEVMYGNLDHYGTMETVSVVKSCTMNGQTSYTDHGDYQKVVNMSDHTEPVLGDGTVTWNFAESPKGRFYYQCGLTPEQAPLPWSFDISYKLNGVPVNGEDLAGASGLVEIRIQATAREDVPDYFRNNMILAAAVLADGDTCYSVEAGGAQIQTMGDQTAVVFTALPGEDGDYTVRLGSDCFELSGVFLAMAPGTVEDLERIADLKETKDTWKESGDQLYDSMEQMARSVEAMREGITVLQSGLDAADQARSMWSGSKDRLLEENDRTLEALTAVSRQMETLVPHLETAQEAARTVHGAMGDIAVTLRDMEEPLADLNNALCGIRDNAEDLSDRIPSLTALMQKLTALDAALQSSEQIYVTQLAALAENLALIQGDYYEEDLYDGEIPLLNDLPAAATPGDASPGGSGSQGGGSQGGSGSQTGGGTIGAGGAMDAAQLMETLMQKKAALESLSAASDQLSRDLSGLMEDLGDSAEYTADVLGQMDLLIEETASLRDSLAVYYPDLQAGLEDSKTLVDRLVSALDQGVSTAAILQNTMRESQGSVDAAARESIRGTMELLDKSMGLLDSTTAMRQAGRTMKDALDREWDDLDGETRFLYLDPSAEKVSFNSPKNQEPDTLQILLRTEEISLDSPDEVLDVETEAQPESPLQRMWNVLAAIWAAIVEIFKNR